MHALGKLPLGNTSSRVSLGPSQLQPGLVSVCLNRERWTHCPGTGQRESPWEASRNGLLSKQLPAAKETASPFPPGPLSRAVTRARTLAFPSDGRRLSSASSRHLQSFPKWIACLSPEHWPPLAGHGNVTEPP